MAPRRARAAPPALPRRPRASRRAARRGVPRVVRPPRGGDGRCALVPGGRSARLRAGGGVAPLGGPQAAPRAPRPDAPHRARPPAPGADGGGARPRPAQLSEPARDLVGVAATIGRDFTSDVLAQAGTADDETLVRALDELWRRR